MNDAKQPAAEIPLHTTTLLVASARALNNALDDLGFEENDDRVMEHDGRLAFLTCSHDPDCDDLFALIAALATSGESWELQSRIDTGDGKAVFQTMARQRSIEAAEVTLSDSDRREGGALPFDLDTDDGAGQFRVALQEIDPATVFATIRPGPTGRALIRVVQRDPRRVLVSAIGPDEATLRATLREVLPTVILGVAMKPDV
jgi:hypothetical protein